MMIALSISCMERFQMRDRPLKVDCRKSENAMFSQVTYLKIATISTTKPASITIGASKVLRVL